MRHRTVWIVAGCALVVVVGGVMLVARHGHSNAGAAAASRPAATKVSFREPRVGIEGALRDGRAYLYEAQQDGQWGAVLPAKPQFAREVPMVLRALLDCGENMADPRIAPYVHRVSNWEVTSYWALNERIQVDVLLKVHPALWQDDLSALLDPKQQYLDAIWMKDPTVARRPLELGAVMESAAALAEKGVEVPKGFWMEANRYWRRQLAVCVADVTSDNYSFLEALRFVMLTNNEMKKLSGDREEGEDMLVQRALAQLPERYNAVFTHMNRFAAIELLGRVMRQAGQQRIGGRDWLVECTAFLLAAQREDGSWGNGMADTARTMMFLNRGAVALWKRGPQMPLRPALAASAKAAREAERAQYPPLAAMTQMTEKQRDDAKVLKSVTLALIGNSTDPDSVPPLRALREALRASDTTLNVDLLELGQWKLQRYETAWVSATELLRLGALQRMEVKRFIEIGGTLIVTSEDGKMTDALERQMVRALGEGMVVFGAPAANDVGLAKSVRVGRVGGRRAVVINADSKQSDDVLLALLAGKGK